MTETPAITMQRLSKAYGSFWALTNLDLTVDRGEVFGFLGPNGAGKTTTIRTLTDEIRPTGGTAQILGIDCQRNPVDIRRQLGYLPGDLALYPKLTGLETLRYFANLRGGVDDKVIDSLAQRLDADLNKRVGELSTGNRQKIGIIQAFMHRPDVIIMDEPSTGLDPLVQAEFQAMMREVADDGRTIFLSSHTLSEVQRVADRVGIIRKGGLVAIKTIAALQANASRRVTMRFDAPIDANTFRDVRGVKHVVMQGETVQLTFLGDMTQVLDAVRGAPALLDISTHDADLEEIFLTYYRNDATRDMAAWSPKQAGI